MTSTKTAQLPYADAFVPYVKYCITWVNKSHSKLSCYTGVKFLKNILVKGIVSKAAMKGMSENLTIFMPILKGEASKHTHKKRRGSKEKLDQVSSLKRGGTIRRPSSKNLGDDEKSTQVASPSGWYDHVEAVIDLVRDFFEALPFVVRIGGAAFLVLWMMYSWLRAGPRHAIYDEIIVTQNHAEVSSRAVYLRDINEGLLNADTKPAYGHSER